MKIVVFMFIVTILLTGCATTKTASPYSKATSETKQMLYQDLKSGRLEGKSLDYIKSTYGRPDAVSGFAKKTLIIYRRHGYFDSAYLWFDENKQLESWSH